MIARALVALLVALALVGGGYRWGDRAATNRDAAQALTDERNKLVGRAIAASRVTAADSKTSYDIYLTSSVYQKGLSDGAAAQKNAVARYRAGDISLSVPTRPAAAGIAGLSGGPAAGVSRCDGPARAELSDEAAEFLTGLASEADAVVLQLGACQANVRALQNDARVLREQCFGEPARP